MKFATTLGLVLLLALGSAGVVQAQAVPVESCMDLEDSVMVTWDCDFEDSMYTEGDLVEMTVTWSVDTDGPVAFCGFVPRGNKFTPRDKKDAVEGTEPVVGDLIDGANGSVTVSFLYLNLHDAGKSGKKKGNAHFHLLLKMDADGDGVLDENPAKFGVNLHVTDPADDPEAAGIFQSAEDPGTTRVSWGAIKSRFDN